MSAPQGLLDAAIYTKLTTDSAVAAMVVDRVIEGQAPEGTAYPLILFKAMSGGDTNRTRRRDVECEYLVEGVSPDPSEAMTLAGLIQDCLHDTELTVSGWSNYLCQCTTFFRTDESVEGTWVYRRGSFVEIGMDAT